MCPVSHNCAIPLISFISNVSGGVNCPLHLSSCPRPAMIQRARNHDCITKLPSMVQATSASYELTSF